LVPRCHVDIVEDVETVEEEVELVLRELGLVGADDDWTLGESRVYAC